MSWTLRKKLAQKRSRAGRWSWARERESWTSFASLFPNGGATDIVVVILWGQQLRGAVVAAQCRTDTALSSCCSGGGPRQPWSSGLAPVSRFHSSAPLFPLVPVPSRPFPRPRWREFGTSIAPCRLCQPFNRGECTVISLEDH